MKTLKYLLVYTLMLASLPVLVNAQNTLALFNGENLDGWYAFNKASGVHQEASELFAVEQGMIRLYGKKAGYLMSDKSFKNFQLRVEFRWNTDESFARKSQKKNSGVMYLIPQDAQDMIWPKGIQFQVKEGATGDFIFLQETSLKIKGKAFEPGKSVVVERQKDTTKPIGEWNTLEIRVKNGKVKQLLNGSVVNKGKNASISEGRILLQYEGYPIDFRKVEVKTKR